VIDGEPVRVDDEPPESWYSNNPPMVAARRTEPVPSIARSETPTFGRPASSIGVQVIAPSLLAKIPAGVSA
jgi:hypothetical protein